MKAVRYIVMVLLLMIIGIAIGIALSVDNIAKNTIESYGSKVLGAPVKVGKLNTSLLAGELLIEDLTIENPMGFKHDYALRLERILIDISLSSLLSNTVVINDFTADHTEVVYEFSKRKQTHNLLALYNNVGKYEKRMIKHSEGEDRGNKKKILINRFKLMDTEIIAYIDVELARAKLPNIELRDIGKESGGLNYVLLIEQILDVLMQEVSQDGVLDIDNYAKKLEQKLSKHFNELRNKVDELSEDLKKLF